MCLSLSFVFVFLLQSEVIGHSTLDRTAVHYRAKHTHVISPSNGMFWGSGRKYGEPWRTLRDHATMLALKYFFPLIISSMYTHKYILGYCFLDFLHPLTALYVSCLCVGWRNCWISGCGQRSSGFLQTLHGMTLKAQQGVVTNLFRVTCFLQYLWHWGSSLFALLSKG